MQHLKISCFKYTSAIGCIYVDAIDISITGFSGSISNKGAATGSGHDSIMSCTASIFTINTFFALFKALLFKLFKYSSHLLHPDSYLLESFVSLYGILPILVKNKEEKLTKKWVATLESINKHFYLFRKRWPQKPT